MYYVKVFTEYGLDHFPTLEGFIWNLVYYWEALARHQEQQIQGSIVKKRKGERVEFYHQYYENGKKIQTYIRKEDIHYMFRLMERREHLKKRRQEVEKLVGLYIDKVMKVLAIIKKRREARRQMQQMRIKGMEEALRGYMPQKRVHQTLKGDFVRSKSEVIEANLLYLLKVPYEYEKKTRLGDDYILPDFTIYWKGKIIYWEHWGIEDEEYQQRKKKKMEIYKRNNFIEGVNLICTGEHAGVFDTLEVLFKLKEALQW